MTYPINTTGGGPTPSYGGGTPPASWALPPPGGGPPPAPFVPAPERQPQQHRNGSPWRRAGIAAAIVATAIGGGAVGALITAATGPHSSQPAVTGTPSSATASPDIVHEQDVKLCTSYAVMNTTIPRPYTSATDLLPAMTVLQEKLDTNPAASTEVRDAITRVVDVLYARVARYGEVRERGLAEPPVYDQATAQAAMDHAWQVCQLDK